MEMQIDPNANGLAVIITNDYIGCHPPINSKYATLSGTRMDGKRLKEAFERLQFQVYYRHNVTKAEMEKIMLEVKGLNFQAVKHFKCIAFVFSGHGECETVNGERRGVLITQDGLQVDTSRDFIESVTPGGAPELGMIPKVFIIDACRGSEKTGIVSVPARESSKGGSSVDPEPQEKGSYEIQKWSLPKNGNFLVAYSTLPECTSYDSCDQGSLWLDILAKKLPTPDMSLEDILSEVNGELHQQCQHRPHRFQQPEKIVRLNGRLILMEHKSSPGLVGMYLRIVLPARFMLLNCNLLDAVIL